MAAVTESLEISRRPEDVFNYATDFSRFPEWQAGVVSAQPESAASPAQGAKALVTRRVGPRSVARTEEITELDPPRTWAVRGIDGGAITAIAKGKVEPLDDGERSRLTIALDFQGHGIGRLLVPLIRRQARQQLPGNEHRLKELLERHG